MGRFLTVEDVADLRRTTPQAIYSERSRGGGPPAYRSGRRLLFDETEVLDWLKAQRDGGSAVQPTLNAISNIAPIDRAERGRRDRTG